MSSLVVFVRPQGEVIAQELHDEGSVLVASTIEVVEFGDRLERSMQTKPVSQSVSQLGATSTWHAETGRGTNAEGRRRTKSKAFFASSQAFSRKFMIS